MAACSECVFVKVSDRSLGVNDQTDRLAMNSAEVLMHVATTLCL